MFLLPGHENLVLLSETSLWRTSNLHFTIIMRHNFHILKTFGRQIHIYFIKFDTDSCYISTDTHREDEMGRP